MQYANSANISRINKGLKRRRDITILGFNIDPRSGYWAKSEEEEDDSNTPPDQVAPVRIVPIVRDRKNALLLRMANPEEHSLKAVATLQHALLRGIEVEFQLEEGEVLGEPLPSRDNRRAILAYEATEGGAGVLSQLIEDEEALRRVARTALTLMHYDNVDEAINEGDASILRDQNSSCVRGCYRCLLSYFNQPDHEKIDRTNEEVKQLLIDLARGRIHLISSGDNKEHEGWPAVFKQLGLPLPDGDTANFGEQAFSYVWKTNRVAAICEIPTPAALAYAEKTGWTLFQIPKEPTTMLSPEFLAILKD
jgi:hypothetical protein